MNLKDKRARIFCLSMQRTGTTSVEHFCRDFGYRCTGWSADARNRWSVSWYEGNFEKIFSSDDFIESDAFTDSPWWMPGFYKVLYHRFPGSKFILFTRDPDEWFKSLINHFNGGIGGWSYVHCKVYRREDEYFHLLKSKHVNSLRTRGREIDADVMKIIGHNEHYKKLYQLHTAEVEDFFSRYNPEALFVGSLEDPNKWQKLGNFLKVDVPDGYNRHLNATRRERKMNNNG